MSSTVLAQGVIEIVAKGVEKTITDAKKTASAITQNFGTISKEAFQNLGRSALAAGAVVSGFFAYFARGAMAGTVEGDRFSRAIEMATRAVGDMFAPVVRLATQYIERFTAAVLSIPPRTRMMIGGIIAAVAALTALGGAFLIIKPVLGPLGGLFLAVASPMRIFAIASGAVALPMRLLLLATRPLVGAFGLVGAAVRVLISPIRAAAVALIFMGTSAKGAAVSMLGMLNPMKLVRAASLTMSLSGRGIGSAFLFLASPLRVAAAAAGLIARGFAMIGPALMFVLNPVNLLRVGFIALRAAFGIVLGPIGIIISILVSLAASMGLIKMPMLEWKSVATNVLAALLVVWDGIVAGFNMAMEGMSSAWNAIGQPVLDTLQSAWDSVSEGVGTVISDLTTTISEFFSFGESESSLFVESLAGISEMFLDIYSTVEELSSMAWDVLAPAFEAAYQSVSEMGAYLLNSIGPAIDSIGETFAALYTEYVKPSMEAIGAAFGGLYNDYMAPTVNWISDAWVSMVGKIEFSWIGAMKFLKDVLLGTVLAIAQTINGIGTAFGYVIKKILDGLAWVAEKTNILSKATIKQMRDYGKAIGDIKLIDTDKLTGALGGASNRLDEKFDQNKIKAKEFAVAAEGTIGGMFDNAKKRADIMVQSAVDGIKNIGKQATTGPGFKIKMDVAFESLQGTFERLQKALATGGISIEQAQLGELKQMNAGIQKSVASLQTIENKNGGGAVE
jgi:hypothetical protein